MIRSSDDDELKDRVEKLEARVVRLESMLEQQLLKRNGLVRQEVTARLELGESAVRLGLRFDGLLYAQPVFVRYTKPVGTADAVEILKRKRIAFVRIEEVGDVLSALQSAGWSVPEWNGGHAHV